MTTFHAVVWMDHTQAHVLMFDREHVEAQRVKARSQHTPKHGHVGADKAFFEEIARALQGVSEVLVTGPANAKIEFRDFCKHHAHAVHVQNHEKSILHLLHPLKFVQCVRNIQRHLASN